MKTLRLAVCSLLVGAQAFGADGGDYTFKDGIALQKALVVFEKRLRGEPQDNDANELAAVMMGYLRGCMSSADYSSYLAGTGRAYGIPDSISLLQVSLVISKYLQDNPARLNLPAAQLVGMALKDGFPKTTPPPASAPAAK